MLERAALLILGLLATLSTAKNHCDTLGVDKRASPAEIKAAYRSQAKIYHPDKNSAPDATEKFAEISTAYEELHDERSRRVYDAQLDSDQRNVFRGHHGGNHRQRGFGGGGRTFMMRDRNGQTFMFSEEEMFNFHGGHHNHFHQRHQQQHVKIGAYDILKFLATNSVFFFLLWAVLRGSLPDNAQPQPAPKGAQKAAATQQARGTSAAMNAAAATTSSASNQAVRILVRPYDEKCLRAKGRRPVVFLMQNPPQVKDDVHWNVLNAVASQFIHDRLDFYWLELPKRPAWKEFLDEEFKETPLVIVFGASGTKAACHTEDLPITSIEPAKGNIVRFLESVLEGARPLRVLEGEPPSALR